MLTIQDILQFHFSPTSTKLSSQKVIPITLSTLNDHRIDKLQQITEAIGVSSYKFSGNNLIPSVFRKFKNSITNHNVSFERRELRTLTYSLSYSEQNSHSIFSDENELESALLLLDSHWRDSFLAGMLDCLLRNWETQFQKSLERLEQHISYKLENYNGSRSTLISLRKNKRFFNTKNGSETLGYELAVKNISLPNLTKYLGVPQEWISYEYFSKSITAYYQKSNSKVLEVFDDLNTTLISHQSGNLSASSDVKKTAKRLISKIIIQSNQAEFASLQDKVKGLAFKQIGDPGNTSNWTAFENATEIEKGELVQAKNILNEWITREFINVFFKICINDERRKKFWLRFTSNIKTFKVYGPVHTKYLLKRNERISKYVDTRFETVSSKRDVSAFILYIGDYMLIEFSNEGYACCAYKINSPNQPSLNYRLNSVDDLRNSALPLAIQSDANYYYSSEEGRLFHSENWEFKFKHWLDKNAIK